MRALMPMIAIKQNTLVGQLLKSCQPTRVVQASGAIACD
jgi:hypothetical protein